MKSDACKRFVLELNLEFPDVVCLAEMLSEITMKLEPCTAASRTIIVAEMLQEKIAGIQKELDKVIDEE